MKGMANEQTSVNTTKPGQSLQL